MNNVAVLDLYDYMTNHHFDYDDLLHIINNLPPDVKLYKLEYNPGVPGFCKVEFTSPNFKDSSWTKPQVKLEKDLFYRLRVPNFDDCYDNTKTNLQPGQVIYASQAAGIQSYSPPNITPQSSNVTFKCNPNQHVMVLYRGLIESYKFCKICGEKE